MAAWLDEEEMRAWRGFVEVHLALSARLEEELHRQHGLNRGDYEVLVNLSEAPGDRLTGLYEPGRGMRLWRGSEPLGASEDAELARLFFGIWLSPRTSEPGLRKALLAGAGAGP